MIDSRRLYRGRRVDNGEWAHGFYSSKTKGAWQTPIENGHYITIFKKLDNGEIILTGMPVVDPATVGQCTGIHAEKSCRGDKLEDLLVFEHDRLRVYDELSNRTFTGRVAFDNASFMIIGDDGINHYRWMDYECEIIGTVHDAGGEGV